MKEDNVKTFLSSHKETLPEDGFNARLFNTLDCLPQPRPAKNRSSLIIGIFSGIGFLLFVLLGGYSALLNGLSSMDQVFVNIYAITPDVLTACIMLGLAFIALIRFAARSYNQ